MFENLDVPEYIFEDDIIVYDDNDEEEDQQSGDAISSPIRLWIKNGTEVLIPYSVPSGLSDHQKRQINTALAEFNMKTCIK